MFKRFKEGWEHAERIRKLKEKNFQLLKFEIKTFFLKLRYQGDIQICYAKKLSAYLGILEPFLIVLISNMHDERFRIVELELSEAHAKGRYHNILFYYENGLQNIKRQVSIRDLIDPSLKYIVEENADRLNKDTIYTWVKVLRFLINNTDLDYDSELNIPGVMTFESLCTNLNIDTKQKQLLYLILHGSDILGTKMWILSHEYGDTDVILFLDSLNYSRSQLYNELITELDELNGKHIKDSINYNDSDIKFFNNTAANYRQISIANNNILNMNSNKQMVIRDIAKLAVTIAHKKKDGVHTQFNKENSNPEYINRKYSQLVLRLADNEGLSLQELDTITGSGIDGNVTQNDVLYYIKHKTLFSENKSNVDVSFEKKINNPSDEIIWNDDSVNGLVFDVGTKTDGSIFKLTFANGTTDYFAIVGGRPGYGKSVLLHNIILSGCIKYSPEELEFFLFDYANGSSFFGFEKLPNVRVLSITKEREYGISTLSSIFTEMERRGLLFKQASESKNLSIHKYEDFRKLTSTSLPRIVVIIDEFQVLLSSNDRLSNLASKNIENIIKESRKFGIHLILCTQKYIGVDLDISLISQRIAFNLSAIDSEKLLGNRAASSISKVGEAIANNKNGETDANVYFTTIFNDNLIESIDTISNNPRSLEYKRAKNVIFESELKSDISKCDNLHNDISKIPNDKHPIIYFGTPKYISDSDLSISLKNSYRCNILYTGHDQIAAVRSLLLTNYQLQRQCGYDSHFYILNNLKIGDPTHNYYTYLDGVPGNITFHTPNEVETIIDSLHQVMHSRLNESGVEEFPKIVFSGINIDTMRQFRDISIGYNVDKNSVKSKLVDLIKNGPDVHIHTILYVATQSGLANLLGSQSMFDLFAFKIVSKGLQDMRGLIDIKQDDMPTKSDHCYLRVDDPIESSKLLFNPDPFVIYNHQSKNISCFIDSIFNTSSLNEKIL